MKTSNYIYGAVAAGLLAIGLVASLRADPPGPYALAPQQPNFYRSDTNAGPVALTNGQVVTFTNAMKLTLRQDKGLSIFTKIVSTNAVSVSETNTFVLSYDGSTFTTSPTFTIVTPTLATAGTNVAWTNIPPSTLNNVRCIMWSTAGMGALATGTNVTAGVTYSWSGE